MLLMMTLGTKYEYLINTLNGFDRCGDRVCWQVTQLLQRDSQTGSILFLGLNAQTVQGLGTYALFEIKNKTNVTVKL